MFPSCINHRNELLLCYRNVTMRRNLYSILLLLVLLAIVVFYAHSRKRYITTQGTVWTTEYHITYEARFDMVDSINAVLARIDESASAYNQSSLVSQFNTMGNVVVDDILTVLVEESLQVYELSDGAYDPTVMPLVKAWKKAAKENRNLSQGYIDSLCSFVGFDKIKIVNDTLRATDKRVQLDFSSIAKGLACDEMGRMLERNGVENYLVEIGGEVVAHGVNDRGEAWHVSVDQPVDDVSSTNHESGIVLAMKDVAVATSGNYRQFSQIDGKRVTHIIDPRTGKAQQSDLLSVTVVATHCVTADAWATACMAMGTKVSQTLMEKNDKVGVMTISADSAGNYIVWSNAAFTNYIPSK